MSGQHDHFCKCTSTPVGSRYMLTDEIFMHTCDESTGVPVPTIDYQRKYILPRRTCQRVAKARMPKKMTLQLMSRSWARALPRASNKSAAREPEC